MPIQNYAYLILARRGLRTGGQCVEPFRLFPYPALLLLLCSWYWYWRMSVPMVIVFSGWLLLINFCFTKASLALCGGHGDGSTPQPVRYKPKWNPRWRTGVDSQASLNPYVRWFEDTAKATTNVLRRHYSLLSGWIIRWNEHLWWWQDSTQNSMNFK
jgi:hypothetical protein